MSFSPLARRSSKQRDLSPEHILRFADERWVDFPGAKPGGYAVPTGPIAPLPDLFRPFAPAPSPSLGPPVMPFSVAPPTFPPNTLGPLSWFNTMFADLEREHAQVQQLSEGCAEIVGGTHQQSGLALAEFAQEAEEVQGFLNLVGATAGRRVVKEILQGVKEQVDGWFHESQEGGEEEDGEDTGP